MKPGELDLCPGSRHPRDPQEMDFLLRRVPEFALLPELAKVRFARQSLASGLQADHRVRISRLADRAYLERLEAMLDEVRGRAEAERNGGLLFLTASLRHFVTTLPPERHPLVVALYFLSLVTDASEETPEALALCMDEYEALG
jgi:hypothetical protein